MHGEGGRGAIPEHEGIAGGAAEDYDCAAERKGTRATGQPYPLVHGTIERAEYGVETDWRNGCNCRVGASSGCVCDTAGGDSRRANVEESGRTDCCSYAGSHSTGTARGAAGTGVRTSHCNDSAYCA